MAQIAVTSKKDFEQKIAEQSWFGVADPCCGSGAMAIALAKVLEQTYKVQDLDIKLLIELTDIDYTCVKMAFVNMSLLGLSVRVILGDTIFSGFVSSKFRKQVLPQSIRSLYDA